MITEPHMAASPQKDLRAKGGTVVDTNLLLGSIEFRVVRNGTAARRMRINTTRCTLGSGEGCTVRLNDPSLRPMHAVLLRDANRVLLRAYTVPIEVNGHLTGETFLHIGDSFILGSYQFELVHPSDISTAHTVSSQDLEPTSLSGNASIDSVSASAAWSVVVPQPASSFDDSETAVVQAFMAKRKARLSFSGGGGYISEALQSYAKRSSEATENVQSSNHVAETERLFREVASYRQREQDWKAQEAQTRAELSEAIARFHQSQDRAQEAMDAVKQMRLRMSKLTEEMESLANDSVESREQADLRQEKYRQTAEVANQARDAAILQRDEAQQKVENSRLAQLELTKEHDRLEEERDAVLVHRQQAIAECKQAVAERNEAVAKHDELAKLQEQAVVKQAEHEGQHEELQKTIALADQQALNAANAVDQADRRMESLSDELSNVTDQLRIAREEVVAAQVQIEGLTTEIATHQEQLAAELRISTQSKMQQESLIEELRADVCRLEHGCAAARDQVSAASNDQELIESLRSRLSRSDLCRNEDKLTWEQEATLLQETIQQLSIDLASATSQLSQKDGEHEATQAELNNAYDRLTTVRRELAARPTNDQLDGLQDQLVETERQLLKTEEQLVALRREYDEFLERHSLEDKNERPAVSPLASFVPLAIPAETVQERLEDQPSNPERVDQQREPERLGESGDHGWPTYEAIPDSSPQPTDSAKDFERDEEPSLNEDSWKTFNDNVADRLSSYTSHDELLRHPPSPLEIAEVVKPVEVAPTELPIPSEPIMGHALSGSLNLPFVSNADEQSDLVGPNLALSGIEEFTPAADKQSTGLLAKQLIAQLNDAKTSSPREGESDLVSQSLGTWVASPSLWQRVANPNDDVAKAKRPDAFSTTPARIADAAWSTKNDSMAQQTALDREPAWGERRRSDVEDAVEDAVENDEEPVGGFEQTYMLSEMPPREKHDTQSLPDSFRSSGSNTESAARENDVENHRASGSKPGGFDFHSEAVQSDRDSIDTADSEDEFSVQTLVADISATVDDDSIEAYMNRLLQRVQGHNSMGSDRPPATPVSSLAAPEIVIATKEFADGKETETVTASKLTEVINPNAPIVPRSQSPEDAGNLALMRELANASANSAISVSARGQAEKMKSRAIMDLMQAGIVMVCAFAFYTCGVRITTLKYVWFTASALAMALSVFYIFDMLKKLAAAKMTYDDVDASEKSRLSDE